ncbi:ATP-binding protein [Rubrivivax sp. A210]|uniref:ATP-binding protein n=1 Tax=Rubrivivax sp. A210 TaxID=2772301 RepID=UPI001917DF61|nr:ATP-binding protein [Rubrivivax sp. A210]
MAMPSAAALNAHDLEQELAWFARLVDARFKLYFGQDAGVASVLEVAPPDLASSASPYAGFLRHYGFSLPERAAVVLALVPQLRPQLLDIFHTRNQTFDRRFTEFGGARDAAGDFLPTGETLAFLIAGSALEPRFALQSLFDRDHCFARHDILRLLPQGRDEPLLRGTLRLADECAALFTTGHARRPDLSIDFPARHIETALAWDDLVLHPGTLTQVREIEIWLRHGNTLMEQWGMGPKLRPGYRALFYGPPGTGKTMTACLLGKATGREVYKVDLSLVVSKYIGETEKNLARVFDQAQHKGWILFFDEADALFGKRTETKDAHDRYANQEVSFLLQRIETFDGIAILASNQKDNIDAAFARRFESMIYFPVPRQEERLQLWRRGFAAQARFEDGIDLARIAAQHEMCGGAIINVVRYASLQALEAGDSLVTAEVLQRGIRRELTKEGKS